MRILEYPSTGTLNEEDVFLMDGPSGTRTLKGADSPFAIIGLCGPRMHRMIFRGKNLGTTLSSVQKAAIQDGSFNDLWLGDYWVINGVTWRIADFNYWLNFSDTKFTDPHLVIVPDTALSSAAMNASSVTTGAYIGSQMYTTNILTARSAVTSAFGTAVKSHREYFVNTVASGLPSVGAWYDSTADLMNEPMVYGSYIYSPASNGSADVKRYTISNRQLALFSICPEFLITSTGYWLRDVASATHFASVDSSGGATATGAANSYGIRPVFAIG